MPSPALPSQSPHRCGHSAPAPAPARLRFVSWSSQDRPWELTLFPLSQCRGRIHLEFKMAQGRGNAFVFALAVLALLHAAVATDYTVGDAQEWTFPPGTDTTYYTNTWAAKHSFVPGDNLVFKYAAGAHDVQIVTAAEYAGCLTSNGQAFQSGSDTIPLPKAGDYYFVCNFVSHCDQGMKMKVTVKAAGGTPPAVAPVAPAPKATPPVVVLPPPVKAPAPAPVVKAPAPAPVVKAPAPAPVVKAPAPAPVAVPVPAPVVAPTPPVVVPAAPAPAPASSSGSSLRVCLSFVAVAAIAALLV